MKLLTLNLADFDLAVRAEDVVSVGKPYSQGRVHRLNLEALLGIGTTSDESRPRVTCRFGKRIIEFQVDRILGLEDLPPQNIVPWPSLLRGNRFFQGVARQADRLILILDMGTMADEASRHRQ